MKVYQILLIIILVLAIILGVKVYNANKAPEYSHDEVIEILKKVEKIENYSCKRILNGKAETVYLRDRSKVFYDRGLSYTYKDYNTDTYKTYGKDNKTIETSTLNTYKDYEVTNCTEILVHNIEKSQFIKEEKMDGKKCIKLEWRSGNLYQEYLWVDVTTGLIMKQYVKNLSTNAEETTTYTYEFNVVDDSRFSNELSKLSDYQEIK